MLLFTDASCYMLQYMIITAAMFLFRAPSLSHFSKRKKGSHRLPFRIVSYNLLLNIVELRLTFVCQQHLICILALTKGDDERLAI